jgi:hypothetical protein
MKNEYLISDLYCAGYLLAKGIKLLRLDKTPNSRKCFFVFENPKDCEQATNDFWNRAGSIRPKTYAEAIRSLKDRVFAGIL